MRPTSCSGLRLPDVLGEAGAVAEGTLGEVRLVMEGNPRTLKFPACAGGMRGRKRHRGGEMWPEAGAVGVRSAR